ncbi:transcriptional regulator, GntR family [Psychromonas ingrahamii 37]|uniref:Transcriptional regulator, GntR family n=1 Tax=Psychromonas ingrahamii (strain DSM 17664 / CCUG 51855 / 37) TaxID=357804 RepID=A1SYW9_PSYIN|nr:FadR/GntR family transcriptional regulator [Psychromonas ingrahamii]ABM04684.1 transcriptional regulator, GntR family [Psychromonas ingrahamii 37]
MSSSSFSTISASARNLHLQVARTIAQGILSGALPQGSKIPNEMTLCDQFGVSRTALREAIKLLSSKGLLRSKPKIGTTVTDKTNWNFIDPQLLEWMDGLENSKVFYQQFLGLRKAIEPEACALAAKNASAEQRIELSDTFQKMEEIAKDFDHDRWAEVDMHFHRLIFLSTGNDFYLPFGNVLATIFMSFILYTSEDTGVCIKERRAIYVAIMAGKEEQAREASRFSLL